MVHEFFRLSSEAIIGQDGIVDNFRGVRDRYQDAKEVVLRVKGIRNRFVLILSPWLRYGSHRGPRVRAHHPTISGQTNGDDCTTEFVCP